MAARSVYVLPPLLALLFFVPPPPAAAQRAFISQRDSTSAATTVFDLTDGSVTPIGPEFLPDMRVTSSGEFFVFNAGTNSPWRVRRVSGGPAVTLPDGFAAQLVHPRDTAIFGVDAGGPVRVDLTGYHVWPNACAPSSVAEMDMAPGTDRLFQLCASGEVVVVAADSGAEVRRVTVAAAGQVRQLMAGPAGTTFMAIVRTGAGGDLRRLEVATGAVLASAPWPGIGPSFGLDHLVPGPSRSRALAALCSSVRATSTCSLYPVDLTTAIVDTSLGAILPGVGGLQRQAHSISPDGEWLVSAGGTVASRVHLTTGQLAGQLTLRAGSAMAVTMAWPPLAPVVSAPVVTRGLVDLSWTMPRESPAVTSHVLEAGLAPGSAAVSINLGAVTSTRIPGVPPGRYYVRVRAVNASGTSVASNEVMVDVS